MRAKYEALKKSNSSQNKSNDHASNVNSTSTSSSSSSNHQIQKNEDAKQLLPNNKPNLNPNHEDLDLRAIERRTQTILESGGGNLPSPDNKPEPDHFNTITNNKNINSNNSNHAKSVVVPISSSSSSSSRPSSRAQTAKLVNPESEKEWDTTNAIINRKNSTPEKYYRTPPQKSEAKNETTKSQRNALHTPVNLMLSPDLEPLYDINNEPKENALDQKASTEVSFISFLFTIYIFIHIFPLELNDILYFILFYFIF